MVTNNKKLHKTCTFTDIHFGAKNNSELHNQDCLNYIDWFCDNIKNDPSIDNIMFLGDWYESRSSIEISTLTYSHIAAKKLNELDLPIYFVVGNHDLRHRHTRNVYSTITFSEFKNFNIINEPTIINEIHEGVLISPYLFHDEYTTLSKYSHIPTWWGHFEFKGFVVTGNNIRMPNGPDPNDFKKPKRIWSGHFHKRQILKNIGYIGNTFPTNFSDAGDNERGMMVYDHITDTPTFIDWLDCPKYIKTDISSILEEKVKIYPNSRVKCVADIVLSYEEMVVIKANYTEKFNLREFTIEESYEMDDALSNTNSDVDNNDDSEVKLDSIDELVVQMLGNIETDHIDNNLLIEQYRKLV